MPSHLPDLEPFLRGCCTRSDLFRTCSHRRPVAPRSYVAVWIANHASSADESMRGALSIFGQAYGPRGSRRAVEVIVEKAGVSGVRRRAWRESP